MRYATHVLSMLLGWAVMCTAGNAILSAQSRAAPSAVAFSKLVTTSGGAMLFASAFDERLAFGSLILIAIGAALQGIADRRRRIGTEADREGAC